MDGKLKKWFEGKLTEDEKQTIIVDLEHITRNVTLSVQEKTKRNKIIKKLRNGK
jgi:hypothetical protein